MIIGVSVPSLMFLALLEVAGTKAGGTGLQSNGPGRLLGSADMTISAGIGMFLSLISNVP